MIFIAPNCYFTQLSSKKKINLLFNFNFNTKSHFYPSIMTFFVNILKSETNRDIENLGKLIESKW